MTRGTRPGRRRVLQGLAGGVAAALPGCGELIERTTVTSRPPPPDAAIEARRDALRDEPLDVQLTGFRPDTAVTLTATATDDRDREWSSTATFRTDDEGRVALAEQAPSSGDYEGVRPMGFVWPMTVPDRPGRFFRGNDRFEVDLTATIGGRTAATATLTRRHADPEVTWSEVAGDGVVGLFFEPPGEGPHPGVLALHGSGGNPLVDRGRLLASHGYATLALQYFGDPEPLPPRLREVPLSYFDRARRWLADRPSVAGGGVGVVGTSRGGELALLLGARNDWPAAVVASVPSGLVLDYQGNGASPWAVDGEPVPALDASRGVRAAIVEADEATVEAAIISVEDADAPTLLISAEDDALWPSTYLSKFAEQRLADADVEFQYAHHSYADAGHLVGVPYLPTTGRATLGGQQYGGTPAGTAAAEADSWPRSLAFLESGLG